MTLASALFFYYHVGIYGMGGVPSFACIADGVLGSGHGKSCIL